MPMNYSEEALIRLMQSGDSKVVRSAFERLYARNFGPLYSSAYSYLGDKDLAEDLVHDTFLGIYEDRHRLESVQDFRRHYARSVRHIAIKYTRLSKRDKHRDYVKKLDERLYAVRSETQFVSRTLDRLLEFDGFDTHFHTGEAQDGQAYDLAYRADDFASSFHETLISPIGPSLIQPSRITIPQTLLDKIIRDPSLVYKISPRKFEELVAELFERDGYKVTLLPQTRDGGKDLIIVENRPIGNFTYYVECKRYAPEKRVPVTVVRQLHGAVMADRVTAGMVITTAYFSKPARKFAGTIQSQMSLLDYSMLQGLLDCRLRLGRSIGLYE